jgi:regulator of protease activity HflC (stomatin/prohibitin superfamily)
MIQMMAATNRATTRGAGRALAAIGLLFAAVVLLSGCSGFVVKTGNAGVVINHYTGEIDGHIRHAGYNAQPPFSGRELIEIPTYERTYTMVRDYGEGAHPGDDSVMVNTLSANTLHADVSVTYHILYDPANPATIVALYSKYRTQFNGDDFGNFEETQLRPLFRNAVSNAFGQEPTLEAMTGAGKRKAAQNALIQLNQQLAPDSIHVDEVRVRAVYPDDATKNTLRTHLEAEQNLRLASLNQQLNALQNEKAVSAATAEAQAARIRAASLTPRLVRFKHLDQIRIVGVSPGTIVSLSPAGAPAATAAAAPATGSDATNSATGG